jgi:hypothetical protein
VEPESQDPRESRPRPAGRLLLVLLFSGGLTALSARVAAILRADGVGGSPFFFLLCFVAGLVAGFRTVQAAFRLGRAMRSGYDPEARDGPTANLLWESVKTVWGLGMFALKVVLGFVLWSVFFVLFQKV